jgi:hypothetical protein
LNIECGRLRTSDVFFALYSFNGNTSLSPENSQRLPEFIFLKLLKQISLPTVYLSRTLNTAHAFSKMKQAVIFQCGIPANLTDPGITPNILPRINTHRQNIPALQYGLSVVEKEVNFFLYNVI